MSTVKLSAPVRTTDGEETTISALADAGRITFREVLNFAQRKNPAYFADLTALDGTSTSSGWEISRFAYLSRTGQPVNVSNDHKAQEEQYKSVDPAELVKVNDVYGDSHYIRPGYSPDRLVRTYHADGRRVIVTEGHGKNTTYRHLLIHPGNIAIKGVSHEN